MTAHIYRYTVARQRLTTPAAERLAATDPIYSPEDLAEFLTSVFEDYPDREAFVAVYLNARNQIQGYEVIAVGSLTGVEVHPREVFKGAILASAAGIVVSHNHPSGDPAPSIADKALTERLVEAGKLLGISVMDHLVWASATAFESISVVW